MRPRTKTVLICVTGVAALLAVAVLVLSVISWNFAKPWIGERVSQATGRPFAINGDLLLNWERPAEVQSGWRRFVPWPHLRAHQLALGNAQWASTGRHMATVPQVDFALNPLDLFRKKLSVSSLWLTEPDVVLEIGEEGQKNWTFDQSDRDSPWELVLHDFSLNKGTVRLVDATRKADVTTLISTMEDGSVTWTVSGKMDDDEVSGNGKAGALLSLRDRNTVYPVEAQLQVGKSELAASGTLTNPRQLSALDLDLEINGASMAQLFPLSGIVLPATPRFSTAGRLVGTVAHDNFQLRYEKFKGKVGSSDIAGTLEYLRRESRPLLRGDVVSNRLDLSDLGALIGTDSAEEKKKRGDGSKQPPGKILPAGEFRTERWDAIDAWVQFTGKKIIRREGLPLDDLTTRIDLKNGQLALVPLNFGVAGGKFTAELTIDGNSDPGNARMKVTARGLKLNRLFPKVESMRGSLGEMHVNAQLSGSGNSVAALAASANGEARAFISQGTVSKLLLETMGLNVGSMIVSQLFGDHQVQLNCLASDFDVKSGVMHARTFVVDTEDAIIGVEGQINLARERLALTIRPESKGMRVFSLRSPLHVAGTFDDPDIGVDMGAVGLKAGAAAVLGAVAAPLAALLALIEPGEEEKSPCGALLAQARKKPTAPPPGKKSGG